MKNLKPYLFVVALYLAIGVGVALAFAINRAKQPFMQYVVYVVTWPRVVLDLLWPTNSGSP